MKKTLLLLVFFTAINSFCQNKIGTEKDYIISIPENWIPLSSELINDIQKNNTPDLITYIVGFSKSDSNAMTFPYFIANYNEIPDSGNALFKDVFKIQSDILKNSGHKEEFIIDSINYKFYTEQKLNNITIYRGYSVGGNGILYLNYYSDSNNPKEDKLIFTTLLNSVQHKVKFLNRNIYLEEAEKHKQKSSVHATRALIALGLFLAVYFIRRMMNKKKPDDIKLES